MIQKAGFILRSAAIADADAICEVYLASRKRFLSYAPLAHSDEDVRHWVENVLIPHAEVFVAELNGKIVGVLALTRGTDSGWIDQLYLHPRAVEQGIGSQFLQQAKKSLGSPIRLYTFQANTGARRFYERHGFRPIQFSDGSGNEEHCPDVLYEWQSELSS
jgi:ribosomal protein S18 acetylase RimI-like enzyme